MATKHALNMGFVYHGEPVFRFWMDSLPVSRPSGTMKAKNFKTKLLTVRFQPEELQVIRDAADRQGQTITSLVREALAAAGVPVAG